MMQFKMVGLFVVIKCKHGKWLPVQKTINISLMLRTHCGHINHGFGNIINFRANMI